MTCLLLFFFFMSNKSVSSGSGNRKLKIKKKREWFNFSWLYDYVAHKTVTTISTHSPNVEPFVWNKRKYVNSTKKNTQTNIERNRFGVDIRFAPWFHTVRLLFCLIKLPANIYICCFELLLLLLPLLRFAVYIVAVYCAAAYYEWANVYLSNTSRE